MMVPMRYLAFLFCLAAAHAQTGAPTRADWSSYGGTQYSWRYSSLNQVTTQNVKQLAPAWLFQTGDYSENLHSTPIVENGVMYVITARLQVFALDATNGKVIWHYRYPTPVAGRPGTHSDFIQNRGVAIGAGKVFFGTKDNFMVALDQRTGREEWKVAMDDPKQCGCNITGAPLVVKDKVIIGGNGGDQAHRGYLTALSTKTGRLAWRWYVVPAPGEKGVETWKGDSWRYGGGAPWLTGSYDPELNLLYWGTGNAAADFYDGDRVATGTNKGGPVNLYTASVVALDADTGTLRWYHQEVPDDVWDFDAAYEVLLMDREVKGQMRKILVHMNKSGLTSVLDRVTGEYLSAFIVPEVYNWITGVTEDGKLVGRNEPVLGQKTNLCPSTAGAKSWNSMAYSPRTGYIYTPTNETCNDITSNATPAREGQFYMNGDFPMTLPPNRTTYSHVDAWDPVTGKRMWSMPYRLMLLSSMLATAGDLVFTGDPEGNFFALDARSGDKLWSFQTGAGHRGAAISYSVNGKQYIATTTGWHQTVVGGAVARLFPEEEFRLGSTLVVFALPEGTR